MKALAGWSELSIVVTVLMVWMLMLMWSQRSDAGCTLSFEQPRRLVMSRETDREHLAADMASVDRVARRYVRSTQDPGQQHDGFLECQTTLVREIATRHGVSPEMMASSRQ
jgi:hypothetical protein